MVFVEIIAQRQVAFFGDYTDKENRTINTEHVSLIETVDHNKYKLYLRGGIQLITDEYYYKKIMEDMNND